MSKNKKTTVALLGVLLVAVVITVGVTYALWQITLQQESTNVITTGCFKVTMEEGEAINLTNAYPMSDEDGKNLVPYTFTIKNNCTEKASYVLNLETVSEGEKILKDEYVKASLKNNESELFLNTLNDTNENLEKVIESASKAYKLTEGTLNGEEEKTFELRLWMDENTEAIDEVMNANFMGKITLTSSYVPYKPSNRMIAMDVSIYASDYMSVINETYTQKRKYQSSLKKVVFQNKMNAYDHAAEIVDFSEEKDESILGYYVPNPKENESNSDTYTLYIQANGKIKVNPTASYYFITQCFGRVECQPTESDNALFEGIENLDTSEVTDMSNMFYMFAGDTLNLSNFNTAKVTNMSYMFAGTGNLSDLDISSFDTSNVTDMSYMFYRYQGEILNLNNINTFKVINMDSMFSGTDNLSNLDISSFDTRNVTDMSYMFAGMRSLTNITYGNNFIHKENADIYGMFSDCPANKPTHSSWNGVF